MENISNLVGCALLRKFPHIRFHERMSRSTKWIESCGDVFLNSMEIFESYENTADDQAQYFAAWYTSPQQHVIEALCSVIVMIPITCYFVQKCSRDFKVHQNLDEKQPRYYARKLTKVWGILLIMCIIMQLILKWNYTHLSSHPAFLTQPCHLHSVIMALSSFSESRWASATLHIAATLWWGPFLALVTPDLPVTPLEVGIFYLQHILMMGVIFSRLTVDEEWMYKNIWWNYLGYVILISYHFWILLPVSLLTGINVATMTVPPDPLLMFGSSYRPIWTICCGLLHFMSVETLKSFVKFFKANDVSGIRKKVA